MRTLSKIKEELLQLEQVRKNLLKEVDSFQQKCPHPKDFVTVSYEDCYDNCGAPVYEETYVTYCCLLCEISVTKSYDKDSTKTPTMKECLVQ